MEKRYSGRRRRHLRWLWLLMIPVLAAGYTLWRFGPQRSYTAQQLGLTDLQSPNDADGDGVDDMPGAIPTTDWASAPTSSGRPFRRQAMT